CSLRRAACPPYRDPRIDPHGLRVPELRRLLARRPQGPTAALPSPRHLHPARPGGMMATVLRARYWLFWAAGVLAIVEVADLLTTGWRIAQGTGFESNPIASQVLAIGGLPLFAASKLAIVGLALLLGWLTW